MYCMYVNKLANKSKKNGTIIFDSFFLNPSHMTPIPHAR